MQNLNWENWLPFPAKNSLFASPLQKTVSISGETLKDVGAPGPGLRKVRLRLRPSTYSVKKNNKHYIAAYIRYILLN